MGIKTKEIFIENNGNHYYIDAGEIFGWARFKTRFKRKIGQFVFVRTKAHNSNFRKKRPLRGSPTIQDFVCYIQSSILDSIQGGLVSIFDVSIPRSTVHRNY